MPRHSFESAKAESADSTLASGNEWNAAHIPIIAAASVSTVTSALPLTIAVGATLQSLNVEKIEVTCAAGNGAQTASIANGAAGQVVDVVVVNVNAGTTTTFAITGSFSGGATSIQLPATGANLVGRGVRLIWSVTDTKWTIDNFYNEWPARGVKCHEPIAVEPTAIAGLAQVYTKSIGGRHCLKIVGPSGLDTPLQPAFWQNNIRTWNYSAATGGSTYGLFTAVTAGTYSDGTPTTTSKYTWMHRAKYANVVTTTNQVLGVRSSVVDVAIGSVAGQGGFFFYTRCGFDTWANGGRFFAGMATANTVISADPSTLANTVGFGVDLADNGLIYFITRNASTNTRVSTGFTIVSGKGYECTLFCPPNSSTIYYRIIDINTGAVFEGSQTLTLPVNTTMLTPNVLASNGTALITANQIVFGVNKIYLETDY